MSYEWPNVKSLSLTGRKEWFAIYAKTLDRTVVCQFDGKQS